MTHETASPYHSAAPGAAARLFCRFRPGQKVKATPTPAPVEIDPDVSGEIPAQIQVALDAAYDAWKEVDGKRLKDVNQFTKWRNNYPYKWCGGFVTWCMIQGDLPMAEFGKIKEGEVEGLYHCKEAMPSKMATGYLKMNRTTKIPRKGFVICYGNKSTKFWHVGIVYDIEMLPDGKYRLTLSVDRDESGISISPGMNV